MNPTLIAILAITGALWLTGCGERTPTPPVSSDGVAAPGGDTIAEVKKQIDEDKALAGSQIAVSEQGGFVALSGFTKTLAQKDRAEKIVLDTQRRHGAPSGVLNNLIVR